MVIAATADWFHLHCLLLYGVYRRAGVVLTAGRRHRPLHRQRRRGPRGGVLRVRDRRGTVAKYVGDALMAFWGCLLYTSPSP